MARLSRRLRRGLAGRSYDRPSAPDTDTAATPGIAGVEARPAPTVVPPITAADLAAPGWTTVPPPPPLLAPMPLVISRSFEETLPSRRRPDPVLIQPLGHLVEPDGPSGRVDGLAVLRPMGLPAAAPAPPPSSAPTSSAQPALDLVALPPPPAPGPEPVAGAAPAARRAPAFPVAISRPPAPTAALQSARPSPPAERSSPGLPTPVATPTAPTVQARPLVSGNLPTSPSRPAPAPTVELPSAPPRMTTAPAARLPLVSLRVLAGPVPEAPAGRVSGVSRGTTAWPPGRPAPAGLSALTPTTAGPRPSPVPEPPATEQLPLLRTPAVPAAPPPLPPADRRLSPPGPTSAPFAPPVSRPPTPAAGQTAPEPAIPAIPASRPIPVVPDDLRPTLGADQPVEGIEPESGPVAPGLRNPELDVVPAAAPVEVIRSVAAPPAPPVPAPLPSPAPEPVAMAPAAEEQSASPAVAPLVGGEEPGRGQPREPEPASPVGRDGGSEPEGRADLPFVSATEVPRRDLRSATPDGPTVSAAPAPASAPPGTPAPNVRPLLQPALPTARGSVPAPPDAPRRPADRPPARPGLGAPIGGLPPTAVPIDKLALLEATGRRVRVVETTAHPAAPVDPTALAAPPAPGPTQPPAGLAPETAALGPDLSLVPRSGSLDRPGPRDFPPLRGEPRPEPGAGPRPAGARPGPAPVALRPGPPVPLDRPRTPSLPPARTAPLVSSNRLAPRLARGQDVKAGIGEAFGVDLATVPVDRSGAAARQAAVLGAQAFTDERGVHIPASVGDLSTGSGRALLAHELTHVAQRMTRPGSGVDEGSPVGRRLERQATRVEQAVRLAPAADLAPALAGALNVAPRAGSPAAGRNRAGAESSLRAGREGREAPGSPASPPLVLPTGRIPPTGDRAPQPGGSGARSAQATPVARPAPGVDPALVDQVLARVAQVEAATTQLMARQAAAPPAVAPTPRPAAPVAAPASAPAGRGPVQRKGNGKDLVDSLEPKQVEKLARLLFPLLSYELRVEMRQDRDRSGLLSDLYGQW